MASGRPGDERVKPKRNDTGLKSKITPPSSLRDLASKHASSGSRPSSGSGNFGNENATNESSPLISPPIPSREYLIPDPSQGSVSEDWEEGPSQETKSSLQMMFLTIACFGLQWCWSVELAYGVPYLIDLGVSKSVLSLVLIAGPLSGIIVQPYVGVKSDNSRNPWGKRRPYIASGAIATITALFCLAWAKEIVGILLSIFGLGKEAPVIASGTIIFAAMMIYVLDFVINVIQAGIRALIVDTAPMHQQNDANAWASRMSGVGNIMGFLAGYVDLPKLLPILGNTQFKVLCVLASLAMMITASITCTTIQERDPSRNTEPVKGNDGVIGFIRSLYHSVLRLPLQVGKVCKVQFFAWIGWFPFLFYTTTWIAGLYAEPFFRANPNLSKQEVAEIMLRGTRVASLSLLVFAISTLFFSIVIPPLVQPSYEIPAVPTKTVMTPTSNMAIPGGSDGYFPHRQSGQSGYRRHEIFKHIKAMTLPRIPGLTVRRAWIGSNALTVIILFSTIFVTTTHGATFLLAIIGIPWSVSCWAPFALIAADLNRRNAIRRHEIRPSDDEEDTKLLASGEGASRGDDQAGVIMGIHNVSVASPQLVASLISSVIFRYLQKESGQSGDDSVGWVLRFGGIATIGAACLAIGLKER